MYIIIILWVLYLVMEKHRFVVGMVTVRDR